MGNVTDVHKPDRLAMGELDLQRNVSPNTRATRRQPERFVRQPPRPLALPREVWINPPADGAEPRMLQIPHDTNLEKQLSQIA